MGTEKLERWVELGVRNPFSGPRGRWALVCAELLSGPVLRFIEQQLRHQRVHRAKLAVLALGHAQACLHASEPGAVLASDSIPPRIWKKLPRARGEYLRIVMGAGRAHRALTALVGTSAAIQRVRSETWAACFGDSLYHALVLESVVRDQDVLILGETGTGKESVAQAIQEATPGKTDGRPAPRSALNAAAVPETLVESELFGHVRGAFTGASDTRAGRLRSSAGGCFFLDEVGDLSLVAQVKLLRVMETNLVQPLGSDRTHAAEVRYVAATHQDLATMVREGRFRHDLYQRLAGRVIRLPPLRERPEDIAEIGKRFMRSYARDAQYLDLSRVERFLESPELRRHPFYGNVRELQNALRNLMLGLEPNLSGETAKSEDQPHAPESIRTLSAPLAKVEDWYIRRVLKEVGGNLTQAALRLGVNRTTLRRRGYR